MEDIPKQSISPLCKHRISPLLSHGKRQHQPPHTVPQRHRCKKTRKACTDKGDRVRRRGPDVRPLVYMVHRPTIRRSFLTGFHKRKVARREHAKKKAQLREKQERLETRREVRSLVSPARSSHRAVASSRSRGTGRTERRRSGEGIWGSWRCGNATSLVPS